MSGALARRRLARFATRTFSYPEVGATRGELPAGYDHIRRSQVIGRGTECFDFASDAVRRWALQRATGLPVTAGTERAEPGSVVVIGAGPLTVPCRVVYVVDEPDRRGFAYGTLHGHPEAGEQRFVVRHDPATDDVHLEITAFSKPGTALTTLVAPLTRALARATISRYFRAFD
ncbi:DUF1990 domain-containing protein [Mycobacterium sp. MYCO198283]|uniref:DUF1990 domain-containing protein n=1 Tax=Mycobacterium sp. MYCO198283 TaxID=2883505 RepID=UPI001E5B586E|nr:DUF1990 domain-containing protein [Mycobacterium sp. MYCO198283]MCG5434027.1 DUF1990 domain-containing protein [Mycobacterium sp. MYCO198283]